MPGTSVPASLGMLARAKRFFRRSNQDLPTTVATEIANTGVGGRTQEQSEAAPDTGATSPTGGAQEQEGKSQAFQTKSVGKSAAKPEPEPTRASCPR